MMKDAIAIATEARQAAESAASAAKQHDVGPKVALKTVISQGSDEAVPTLSKGDLEKHFAAFHKVYDRNPRPDEECTTDQLTGLFTLLHRDVAPYVDFGVWGPNHHRLLRKLRLTGLVPRADGTYQNIELLGPPDVEDWQACYQLVITGLLGFEAVTLGPLLDYGKKISK